MSDEQTQSPSSQHQQARHLRIAQPRASVRGQSTMETEEMQPRTQHRQHRRSSTLAAVRTQPTGQIARGDRRRVLTDLENMEETRHNRLQDYSSTEERDNDTHTQDSEMPIYDAWYDEGGSEAIRTMTTFTGSEFIELYDNVRNEMAAEFSSGRGRRSTFRNGDILLMTLTTLKSGTDWETARRPFNISTSTFMRLVVRCIGCISSVLYKEFVEKVDEVFDMHSMRADDHTFESFKSARYATDVTCQQINRPTGNIEEVKSYYSGKHKYYGFKTEVSVLPNGIAISCSKVYRGATSDLRILQERKSVHRALLRKQDGSDIYEDEDPFKERFNALWAMLCDKGYQGAAEFLRCVSPYKKPRNRQLRDFEEAFNAKVARDRIIVENFFGRLQGLWGILDHKWTWRESLYGDVFRLCVALTNYHIERRPLRREDGSRFRRARNRRAALVQTSLERRQASVQLYVNARRARRAEQSRAIQADQTR